MALSDAEQLLRGFNELSYRYNDFAKDRLPAMIQGVLEHPDLTITEFVVRTKHGDTFVARPIDPPAAGD